MQKIMITKTILTVSLFSGSLSSTEITDMVNKIKEERPGISLTALEATKNPFLLRIPKATPIDKSVEIESVIAPKEVLYTLKAIFNRKAFINGKWYKKGDTLGVYRVGNISSNSVALHSEAGDKVLNLNTKKKLIKLNRG